MPTWPCQPPYPRTPNEYTLETKYKDNTKSSEIQIYFRFFAKMVHFAFSACNALNINAEKSSFFQWFLCTFPKIAVLTKVMFQFPIRTQYIHECVFVHRHTNDLGYPWLIAEVLFKSKALATDVCYATNDMFAYFISWTRRTARPK